MFLIFIQIILKECWMRDVNIKKSFKREIDMRPKVVKSKKIYNRKSKHKKAWI